MVWIAPVSADFLRQRARHLEEQRGAQSALIESLPLYGILFAVQDNIDVAGMSTTVGCLTFAYLPRLMIITFTECGWVASWLLTFLRSPLQHTAVVC